MVLDILTICMERLIPDEFSPADVLVNQARARWLADWIAASVPFHLASDFDSYLQQPNCENHAVGKMIGGLLLLHPLNVVRTSTSVSKKQREYARCCLDWIGKNMGIGQASVLANVGETPTKIALHRLIR